VLWVVVCELLGDAGFMVHEITLLSRSPSYMK
jgi:hypothetical protein